jgi:hypothetical protein
LLFAGGERRRNAQYIAVKPALANQQAQAAGGLKNSRKSVIVRLPFENGDGLVTRMLINRAEKTL